MALSGITHLTTAGVVYPLGTEQVNGPLMVQSFESNSGLITVGDAGLDDPNVYTGIMLEAGEMLEFQYVSNLSNLYVMANADNSRVRWLVLNI